MYGSVSDKARISESDRSYNRYVKNYNRRPEPLNDIDEQITAMVERDEPALTVFPQAVIDRLHAEALKMHEQWFMDVLDREYGLLELEDYREREAQYDADYGGYSSDTYEKDGETVVDCWLPFMRLPELRDTFGDNWLGNGFHIVQGNAVRSR